jgi:hypothetical protein
MRKRLAFDRTLGIAALTAALLVAGCGGGGGDGGPTPPPPPQLIQITAQNQDAVARATAATFYGMTGMRALPVSPAPSPRATAAGINDFALRALGKAMAPTRAASKVGRLAIYEETVACTLGGSMTLQLNDVDNNLTVSAGDVFKITFSQCRESDDELVNGVLQMAIAGASETPTAVEMSGLFTFQQLTVVDAGYTSLLNGAMNSTYRESVDPMGTLTTTLTSTVAAGGMVGSASSPALTDTFTYDPGFAMVSTDIQPATPTPAPFSTLVLNGTAHVASLGGRITIVTDPMTPIRDTWGAEYPESGQVTVLGKDSRLRMTVLDTVRVRLELDANNDGAFESTKDVPWTDVLP